ncbi:MAG TPA: pectinesterase family protein [Chthoniobacterales bacterium]|nr:pectinesterase family protein [Chthoniobacterales bacterium]
MKYAKCHRLLCLFVAAGCCAATGANAQWMAPGAKPDAIVAADGGGTHKTVQEAVDAAPDKGGSRFFIQIKPGEYYEKLVIHENKGPITLFGEEAKTTILTYDDFAAKRDEQGRPLGGANSYSTKIAADGFAAENITFANSHWRSGGSGNQAIALSLTADGASFRKCRMIGKQDTLYASGGRQYFEDCYIEGEVDYIFGDATAFFERCELHCVGRCTFITAASTPREKPVGFVFSNCKITAKAVEKGKTHLGRTWGPHASVTFLNTEMSEVIAPKGWDNWANAENEKTARFAEYRSKGPGAAVKERVRWSRQLTDEEAAAFSKEKVLGPQSSEPETKVGG